MTNYMLDDAKVTYPDWRGTVQLDQRMTAPGIARIVGLDEDEWMIVAFDIGGGEAENGNHDLHVYAVNHELIPAEGDVLPKIAEAEGGVIPVTDFLVHDVDPYEILRAVTHQFEMRMRLRGAAGIPISVVGLGDIPEQVSSE